MKQFSYIIFFLISFSAFAQNEIIKTPDWTFGAEKGYAQIAGEVTPQNGFGFGIFAEKNFGELFEARIQIGMGDMRGLDRTATEKWREHPVWNGIRNPQIDYKNAGSPGVFANYRTVYRAAGISGNFVLTQLPALKNTGEYDFFLTAGIGGMQFQNSIDAADADGAIYDFSVIQIQPEDTEARTLTDLTALIDGKFETEYDDKMTFTPLYQIGAGISRKFKTNLKFSIKHQLSFTNTDLLDSYDRIAANQLSEGNDLWHFTTLSLSYTVFKTKKIEPEPPVIIIPPVVNPDTIPDNPEPPDITDEEEEIVKEAFDNLEFETGLAVIRNSSFPTLNELANLLQKHPTWNLKITGHTDSSGEADYNMQLSKDRAEAVRIYLQNRNIAFERFIVKYFGEERPIASNDTPEGRQKNRRVELEIVE